METGGHETLVSTHIALKYTPFHLILWSARLNNG